MRGWIHYYRAFYPSELTDSLRLLNDHLPRWAAANTRLLDS